MNGRIPEADAKYIVLYVLLSAPQRPQPMIKSTNPVLMAARVLSTSVQPTFHESQGAQTPSLGRPFAI